RRLPAGLFASFARCHASLCCQLGFANNIARRAGVALQPVTELLGHGRVDVAASLGVAEFGFGLTFKLWVGQFHRDDGGEAFTNVITGEVFVFVTQDLLFAGVPVDQRGQRTTEAFFVGTTLVRINGVRILVHRFGVRGGPLHGHFDGHSQVGVFSIERDDIFVDEFGALGRVQVGHVIQQAVFVHVVHTTNGTLGRCCFAVVTFGLQFGFGIGQGFVVGFT